MERQITRFMNEQKTLRIEKIKEGTVLDHIKSGFALIVLKSLNLDYPLDNLITIGINVSSSSSSDGKKDIIKIENKFLTEKQLHSLSLLSPKCKVSLIKNYEVVEKKAIELPEKVVGLFGCPNDNCISREENEPVHPEFNIINLRPLKLSCEYCSRVVLKQELYHLLEMYATPPSL